MSFSDNSVTIGARSSPLSRAQVEEVLCELKTFHPDIIFLPIWFQTTGDKDQKTSLRDMEKSDFFTKEIDRMQLEGDFQVSIHSAKDLPDPIHDGLEIIALTRGVDPSDVLVIKNGSTLNDLPRNCKIGASCKRRDLSVKKILPDAEIVDIRGTIGDRLSLLHQGKLDGVVVAKAALIRLKIEDVVCIALQGEIAPLQGKLAIIARKGDKKMKQLFSCLDVR